MGKRGRLLKIVSKKRGEKMKQLKKDVQKFILVNEMLEDIRKDIFKSINAKDYNPLNVGQNGDLFTNASGFLSFVNVFNPVFVKTYQVAKNLNVLKFYYYDGIYICTILDDSEIEKFKTDFNKLYKKYQIDTILLNEAEEVETCKN